MSLNSDLLNHSIEVSSYPQQPNEPVSDNVLRRFWYGLKHHPFITRCLELWNEYYYERWLCNCILSAMTSVFSLVSLGTQNAISGKCYPSFISFLAAVLTLGCVLILFRSLYKFWDNRTGLQRQIDYFGIVLNFSSLLSIAGFSLCLRDKSTGNGSNCELDCSAESIWLYLVGSLYHGVVLLYSVWMFFCAKWEDRRELVRLAVGSCLLVPVLVMCYLL